LAITNTTTVVRVFVASPSDTASERQQLKDVVQELNVLVPALAPKPIVLKLVEWETDVTPGLGRDAQDVVNQQIGKYDIFVGIMWKRMGTPTLVAPSGTAEEFQRAYAEWQRNKSLPVLFYFSQAPYLINTAEDAEQLRGVIAFRDEIKKLGLVWEYPAADRFAAVIRPHLALVLGRMFLGGGESSGAAAATAIKLNPAGTSSSVRMDVIKRAEQYVKLRHDMPSSDERTRRMSAIAAELRSLAPSAYHLVPELILSASAGERLAAICFLEQIPDKTYLNWLAERVVVENPFPGYHATLALLRAARTGGQDIRPALALAVGRAKALFSFERWQNPDEVSIVKSLEEELGPIEIPRDDWI
jgi:hypothetical protein